MHIYDKSRHFYSRSSMNNKQWYLRRRLEQVWPVNPVRHVERDLLAGWAGQTSSLDAPLAGRSRHGHLALGIIVRCGMLRRWWNGAGVAHMCVLDIQQVGVCDGYRRVGLLLAGGNAVVVLIVPPRRGRSAGSAAHVSVDL